MTRTVVLSPPNLSASLLRKATRVGLKPIFNPRLPLLLQRSVIDRITRALPRPRGVRNVESFLDGVLAQRLIPEGASVGKAVLYLHGGGYVLGSPSTHFGIAARLALAARCEVFVIDYRVAPEHPAPAALHDAISAWAALSKSHPALAVAGDSAGGGLSVALAMAARDAALPLPRGMALMSPWVDLTLSGESMQSRKAVDPLLSQAWLAWAASRYAGPSVLDAPGPSPLFGRLEGLPSTLIHVGSDEVLWSDTCRLERALRQAGVTVNTCMYEGLWHGFQLQAGLLAEADESLQSLGAFLRGVLDAPTDRAGDNSDERTIEHHSEP